MRSPQHETHLQTQSHHFQAVTENLQPDSLFPFNQPLAYPAILQRSPTHPQAILQLQRQYGNRYVNQVLRQSQSSRSMPIQAKLTLGAVGDKYEQEADQVAKQIVNQINAPKTQSSTQSQPIQQVKGKLSANHISFKKQKMHLDFVRMKRKNTKIAKKFMSQIAPDSFQDPGDAFGHWWTEIGDKQGEEWSPTESYGWWPTRGVQGLSDVFLGVQGQLNQGHGQDPHHGKTDNLSADFYPVMEVDDEKSGNQEYYESIRENVTEKIRNFAKSYEGLWQWKLGWGQNCQTFQKALKKDVGLHYEKSKLWFKKTFLERPADVKTLGELQKEAKQKDREEQEKAEEVKKSILFVIVPKSENKIWFWQQDQQPESSEEPTNFWISKHSSDFYLFTPPPLPSELKDIKAGERPLVDFVKVRAKFGENWVQGWVEGSVLISNGSLQLDSKNFKDVEPLIAEISNRDSTNEKAEIDSINSTDEEWVFNDK